MGLGSSLQKAFRRAGPCYISHSDGASKTTTNLAEMSTISEEQMKFTIVRKVGLLLTTVLSLMVLSSLLVYRRASSITEQQRLIATVRLPTAVVDKELQRDMNLMLSKARQAILASDNKEDFEKTKALFESQVQLCQEDIRRFEEIAPH